MKFIKWKSLVLTCLVCLLPILLGLSLWDKLPETMAIHFNLYNQPDNFASRGFVVFGLPLLMMVFQSICCIMNDFNAVRHGERKKLEGITKWIIPSVALVLQIVTLGYGMGWQLDIRAVAALLVGVMLLVTGNYLPKLDYIKNYDMETAKARKVNRFWGYETVIMGILFIISIFLPPIFTAWCLILFIPYTLIGVFYGIYVAKKQ